MSLEVLEDALLVIELIASADSVLPTFALGVMTAVSAELVVDCSLVTDNRVLDKETEGAPKELALLVVAEVVYKEEIDEG